MLEEVEKIIKQERILPKITYQKPFVILLTGDVGSGKSLVSQILSKELNLYLISGDYIRKTIKNRYPKINLHTEEVRKTNNILCLEEIKYCINNKYSIILDRNVSSKKDLSFLTEKIDIPIIFIKLLSSEQTNKERVEKRKIKKDTIIPHYGHQETKSGVVTKEEYNKIKERKIYDLEDSVYDYMINTNTSFHNLYEQLRTIKNKIQENIVREHL